MFLIQVATFIQTIGVGPVGAKVPIVQGTSFGGALVAPKHQRRGIFPES